MDEVVKRNFAALAEGLRLEREVNSGQNSKIAQLESEVLYLRSEVNNLTQKVNMLMAIQMGTGPTKR